MLNAVPDCHPKTPKKYRNETLCRIVINTITRDTFSDQLSNVEMDKSNVFQVTSQVRLELISLNLNLTDFLLDLPTSASNVTSSRFRSWISVVGSVSVEVCLWVWAAVGLHITVPDSPTFTPTHQNIKTATALNVFMLRRTKLSVSARLFFQDAFQWSKNEYFESLHTFL